MSEESDYVGYIGYSNCGFTNYASKEFRLSKRVPAEEGRAGRWRSAIGCLRLTWHLYWRNGIPLRTAWVFSRNFGPRYGVLRGQL